MLVRRNPTEHIKALSKFREGCDLSDESVILVGNGSSPRNKNLGRFVDSFNVIVRFNDVDVAKNHHDLGSRYGHYVLATPNLYNKTEITNAPWESVFYHSWVMEEDKPPKECLDKFPLAVSDKETRQEIMNTFLPLGNYDVPNIKKGRSAKNYAPSTGLLTIFMYLKKYKKVHIYGFDWWDIRPSEIATAKHHYKQDGQTVGTLHHPLVEYSILKPFVDAGIIVDVNPDSKFYSHTVASKRREWELENQPFELKYHQGGNMRDNDKEWDRQWSHIFESFDLGVDKFRNGRLLDVGCGSRPALLYFNSGPQYYADPLLSEYERIERRKDQWDSIPRERKHSVPAEERIGHIVGKCDFVMSWNALDHGYDWRAAVKNCISYLKDDGLFLLGTDCIPHKYHIGIDSEKELREIISDTCEIVKDLSRSLGGLSPGQPKQPWERAVMVLCKKKPRSFDILNNRNEIPLMLDKKGLTGEGAELGVWKGHFSKQILSNSKCSRLYSIDAWNDKARGHDLSEFEETQSLLAPYKDRSVILRSTFKDALDNFEDESLDFIYIDGYAHTGQDQGETIYDWYSKVKVGGFFGGHDYSQEHFPLTYKYVNQFVVDNDLELMVIDELPYPSWYVFKK